VYYEDSNAKLRNEKWNSIWIKRARGQEALDVIGHHHIGCSGTAMGGKVAMVRKKYDTIITSFY
jgi:hypothetical protein